LAAMKGVTEVPDGLESGRFLKKAAQKLLFTLGLRR
jgi:hypothetical protein